MDSSASGPERESRAARILRGLGFAGGRLRRDLDDEIRFHLDTATRRLIDQGMEPEAARAEALRRFGDLERHRAECRHIDRRRSRSFRRQELMNDLLLDLKFAWRNFRAQPAFVLVAVLTLAIGMAANAVVYSMAYSTLLKPLPYGEPGRLVAVFDSVPARGVDRNSVSPPNFADWRRMNGVFTDMAAHTPQELNLTGLDRPERLMGYRVTANLFDVLGVEARLGRTFAPDDDEPGGEPVAILSHRIWETRFGAAPDLVGSTITLDDVDHTVVGVMDEGFEYPQFQFRGDLWVPIRFTPTRLTEPRSWRYLVTVGRLDEGVTVEQAQADMNRVSEGLEQTYPEHNADRRARVEPLQELVAGPIRPALVVMLATVGFVLLICCANVANLFFARGSVRGAELAVRSALGASRLRLVRQMVTEGFVIALAGGLGGFLLSRIALAAIESGMPSFVQRVAPTSTEGGFEWGVLLVTMVVSSITVLFFALLPALRASRVDLQDALRGAAPGGAGRGNRMRALLVVAEVAVSVVLVVGAALMIKGFVGMVRADPGFQPRAAVTFPLILPESGYGEDDQVRAFYSQALDRIRALPGVEAAGASNILPLTFSDSSSSFVLEGRPAPEEARRPVARTRRVTPGYLEAMEIPLRRGRALSAADDAEAPLVAVINETFAARHFPDSDPIGARLSFEDGGRAWREIVGVVGDVRHDMLDYWETEPTFYFPFEQLPTDRMTLVVRADDGEPAALTGPVSEAIWAVDPDLPIGEVQTLEEVVASALFIYRMPAELMAGFAGIALALAAIGLYGVVSYLVAQRRHEIGVRIALGARAAGVVALVVRRGLALAAIGVVLGTVAAFGVGQLLAAVLETVSGREPLVYVGVPALLLIVSAVASWIPARRAAAVDPKRALASE